jgi:hypothetical protein
LEFKRRELFEHLVIQHPRGAIEGMTIARTFSWGVIFAAFGLGGIFGIVLQADFEGVKILLPPNIPFIVATIAGIGLLIGWTLRLDRVLSTLRGQISYPARIGRQS